MDQPLVSVVIPAFNGARWIGEAIRSVLNQTYRNLEVIVVDNNSCDDTLEVARAFADPRLLVISHVANRGADFARRAGVQRARGEIIAYLDQDDYFHPDKLKRHAEFLSVHPDVGFTYNAHFVVSCPEGAVQGIYRPPADIALEDVVLGFPIAPSAWVMRREWALREEIWGEDMSLRGREIVICGRLLLSGCKFSPVVGALNYRRLHAGRTVRNLAECYEAERQCQEIIFSDARCPAPVLAQRGRAVMNMALSWGCVALHQGESELACRLLREALGIEPNLVIGDPCELVKVLMHSATTNGGEDHEKLLEAIFSRLPAELANISSQLGWAVAHGYLLRAARCFLWDRAAEGRALLAEAVSHGVVPGIWDAATIVHELLSYEMEFGGNSTRAARAMLTDQLGRLGHKSGAREIKACYHFNRGLQSFWNGRRREAMWQLTQAVVTRPHYASNRGAIATMLRSLTGISCRRAVNATPA